VQLLIVVACLFNTCAIIFLLILHMYHYQLHKQEQEQAEDEARRLLGLLRPDLAEDDDSPDPQARDANDREFE